MNTFENYCNSIILYGETDAQLECVRQVPEQRGKSLSVEDFFRPYMVVEDYFSNEEKNNALRIRDFMAWILRECTHIMCSQLSEDSTITTYFSAEHQGHFVGFRCLQTET